MTETKLKPCPFCGGEMTVCGSSRLKRFTISHRGDRKCLFYAFEIDWQTVSSIAEAIEAWNQRAELPSAQPEIIRCKDCKYGEIDDPDFPNQYLCHWHGEAWDDGDHFCSHGVRRDKE